MIKIGEVYVCKQSMAHLRFTVYGYVYCSVYGVRFTVYGLLKPVYGARLYGPITVYGLLFAVLLFGYGLQFTVYGYVYALK